MAMKQESVSVTRICWQGWSKRSAKRIASR